MNEKKMQQEGAIRLFDYGLSLHEAVFPRPLSHAEQESLAFEASTNKLFLLDPKHKAVVAGDRRSIATLPKVAWAMFWVYGVVLALIIVFWDGSVLSLPREADGYEIGTAVRDFSILLVGVTMYVVARLMYSKWWRLRLAWGGVLLPAVVIAHPEDALKADDDGHTPAFVLHYQFLQLDGKLKTGICSRQFHTGEVPDIGTLLAVLYLNADCFMLL